MKIEQIIEKYKFLGTTGKRGGIQHYQVVDDVEMDSIISDKADSCGYNILNYSLGCNQGQIQIWASKEAMSIECESLIEMFERDELPYCEDDEEKEEVINKINEYKKILDEIKKDTYSII